MRRRNKPREAVVPVGRRLALLGGLAITTALLSSGGMRLGAQGPGNCTPPNGNPVACENALPGNPSSEWDISGAGDSSIQGFSTDISVNRGQTINFKINTDSSDYRLEIYRMGYYGGLGARRVATVTPSAALPQTQPSCLSDASTGLLDCGNWAISASWDVPAGVTSGIYFAKVLRSDTGGASHIVFVVRDDASQSALLFQTSDTTWHAYNQYGGNSLYVGAPAGRAYKVSYNRPLTVRGTSPENSVFNAEYPMVRWLEANGYDVSYLTGVDTDRRGADLLRHKVFLSVGHDAFWSGTQRGNVEAARAAGVNLAFFSGNEVFWKTRWENSISADSTARRTLVSYKETHANAKLDPTALWTGTWRDPRFSPPADGNRPENSLTGTLFMVQSGTTGIRVPAVEGKTRFWRNTGVAALAPGASVLLPDGTLGFEWDEDHDNGFRPSGLVRMSDTTVGGVEYLQDYGSTYAAGTANHALTFYRHPSGALVFGAGTVQWSWGLDGSHDRGAVAPSVAMQQATINLFADMGADPVTVQAGLTTAAPSTDTIAPTSTITSPANGSSVPANTFVTVSGTAADAGGGVVGGVEISVNGGATWQRATGREAWTFSWKTGGPGAISVRSRAVDDSGRLEQPGPGLSVTVVDVSTVCCSLWTPTQGPVGPPDADPNQLELGTRFRSDVDGYITAIRFFKPAQNTGTHVGSLWTNAGTRLSSVTFTAETASGWQEARLPSPVQVAANTLYVVSYNTNSGFYAGQDNYFAAAGVDNGPLHAPRDGVQGANGVYSYGSNVFPTQTYKSESYWVDVLFATSLDPDTTPPTVEAVTPASGAVNVAANTSVTATFSEDVLNVGNATFDLSSAGGAIAATVSYSSGSRTATLTPSTPLAYSTSYTARVRGGVGGVTDIAGNPLATDQTWSFTTAPPPIWGCPCSFWSSSQVPGVITEPDGSAVELGVKFKTVVDGFITGIRFYKGPQNTGAHAGHLWTSSGALLSTVNFVGESASGWQAASLPQPIAVTANTTYVVSYYTPTGFYSANTGFFGAALVSGPLEASASGTSGGNGVYRYGASGFPADTSQGANYWVDVVFATSIAADTAAPTVVSSSPPANAANVSVGGATRVQFSEAMSGASVNGATFQVRDAGGSLVTGSTTYLEASAEAVLQPATPLEYSTAYSATIKGGPAGVKDLAGNPLAADYVWTFTTGDPAPPPPDEGPGGPILVVSSPANPFTKYYAEVLRAEGLNAFVVSDITAVTPSTLSGYDVVILGEIALSPSQVNIFTNWVSAGGNLILMRPDKKLASLAGLTDAAGTLADAYLRVNTSATPGTGIVGETIQFHGTADLYTLNGATSVATLYVDASTAASSPAITLRSVGSAGGQVAAFTYDLARSLVFTRQGNPAWSGQERDGIAPIRSDELFFGGTQPDYVDRTKIAIPQADEQQRLLANLVLHMNSDRRPLPRFWYFPRGKKAVVVMTGDDHANNGTAGRFDIYKSNSPANCDVGNWECVRATSYIYPSTPITNAQAAAYSADGFEIAAHVTTGCGNYTATSLQASFTKDLTMFAGLFPGVPTPSTNRTHCIAWSDFDTQPQVALANGIRLDTNYYYWPAAWVQNRPGFMTGSGMPMRFAKADGTLIDVYQAATQMTDESAQTWPFTIDTLLDRAIGPEGYYGFFTANMHTDTVAHVGSEAIVASALARSVPVISARQLLTWLDGRNSATYSGLLWAGDTFRFSVSADARANGLQMLLPATSNGRLVTGMTRNGQPIAFSIQRLKGVNYAVFDSTPGDYEALYTVDSTAPAISDIRVTTDANDATVTWTTSEAAVSGVEYGTSPNTMNSSATAPSLGTAHFVRLTGLAAATTYYFRGSSTDLAGNTSQAPAVPAPPMTFTTLAIPSYGCPCSIWTPGQVPVQPSANDTNAVEVGVKFKAIANGYVAGIRFYKGPLNNGTHVGNLWSDVGTLLGTVTFSNESPTGWQQATLSEPVAITANTTYVVSYHSNAGGYSADLGYFQNAGVANGPLRALAEGVSGSNGVFRYGTSGFPSRSFNSANYWVDLVFVSSLPPGPPPSAGVTDTTASDFAAGTLDSAYVASASDGEVILLSSRAEEFGGSALPAGWSSSTWAPGGGASVAGGRVTVDGALLTSDALLDRGQSLEFMATFSTDAYQHGGFALTFNENLWAMFSTSTGGILWARTHDGVIAVDTPIPGNWLGVPHRYRIDWDNAAVTFFVDDTQVASHGQAIGAQMRPAFSDLTVGAAGVVVQSLRLGPYATAGTFVSRVFDAGSAINWASAQSTTAVPPGTSLALGVRFGNTSVPDGSWSSFAAIELGTAPLSATSRYAQYRAVLTGTGAATPTLEAITLAGPVVPQTPVISIADTSMVEGNAGTTYAAFTLSLSMPSANPVSVSYATVDGSATAPTDYVASTGTVVVPAGSTSVPVFVPIVTDGAIEPTETFRLTLSAPVNATLAQTGATGTIVDDDRPVLSIGNSSVLEGNAGSASALFTITLSTASTEAISVNYATSDGTAGSPQDYTAVSGTATFAPGVTTAQVAVAIAGDTLNELNETFTVTLSSPVNAPIAAASGLGTIVDNDPPPSLAISDVSVTETDAGTVPAAFTVTLSAPSSRTVTVTYATADGAAAAATDYTAATGTLTFAPGDTTKQITIAVVGDTLDEPTEVFQVNLSLAANATIADSQGVGTIVDNDRPALSINDVTVTEGNTGTVAAVFTVSLSSASPQPVTVNFATTDGTALAPADYTAASGTLTIPAGALTGQITVRPVGDTLDEPDETFTVLLTSPVNATIVDASGTLTITDNDAAPSLVINNVSVTETDSASVPAIFTVTLSAPSGQVVTVNYASANATAIEPTDYAAVAGTLTFAPGVTTQQIQVPVNGDTLDEPNETYQINLSVAVNATIADAQGIGTIVDNDAPNITIGSRTVTEGNAGTINAAFTVTLSNAHSLPVSVNYTTVDGAAVAPADYTAVAGTLTIAAGVTTATINVPVLADVLDEANETFTVVLSAPVNGTIVTGTGLGTITDDDATPTLVINDMPVTEGDAGTVLATFTVTLSAASGRTVTVNYASANATAIAPADYTAVGGTLTFAPGVRTQQIQLLVNGDTLEEPNKTYQVNLSAAVNATIADTQGIGTILDDDPPNITIGNRTVTEGNTGTINAAFTVTLSNTHILPVSVNYATVDGAAVAPADYTAVAGTLTIPAGATTATINVPVIADVLDEANETFTVVLSGPVNGTIATGTGLGTITDDDATPTLTVSDVTVTEGDTGTVLATFTVTLSAASGRTVTVTRVTANTTATAPADYTALASSTLTFAPGTTTQDVTVAIAGDLLNEADETFQLRLSAAVNATIAKATGIGTIADNDPIPTATINDVTITEANTGTRTITFTVTLSAASGRAITMSYATADGTATAPSDYTAATGTLTFAAGVLTRTIVITTIGDTTVEPSETLLINLSNGVNVTIADAQGVGTILNND